MKDKIEEVKKILLGRATFSCESKGDYSACLPQINNGELVAREICQLFPQPLDDEGLIKEIAGIKLSFGIGSCVIGEEYARKIYALLQPKIEEARRQVIEEIEILHGTPFVVDGEGMLTLKIPFKEWQALKGGE